MPPKRASKRQAAKSPASAVAPNQRRAESRPISTALPESSAQPPESSSQLSPTELGAIISQAISGALQSVGIVQTNRTPAERDSGTNTQSTPQPTVVEDAALKEIEALTNTVAAGRLTFPTEKPEETFSSVTFDLESRGLRSSQGKDLGERICRFWFTPHSIPGRVKVSYICH